jgi:prephenate dehydrogenase
MTPPTFGRVGVVGLGLIGTSCAMAVRRRGLAQRVLGVDPDAGAVATALARGAIDEGGAGYAALEGADLVIVATPPGAVVDAGCAAARAAGPGAVLVDVASVKGAIVRALEAALPKGARYVGGHPMAGSERQGAGSGDDALLAGRPFLIVPTARSDPGAVDTVYALTRAMGMRPLLIDADVHDAVVAQISHLPYLLAVAAINAAGEEALGLGGPAFDGLRRIAASPPALWADICSQNRAAILKGLAWIRDELDRVEGALNEGHLLDILTAAHRRAGGGD